MTRYKAVTGEFTAVTVMEKSKFICSVKGVADETEAKTFIDAVRKKYYDATHNCYAYIADEQSLIQKCSDDGEPQGTAGLPMLNALKARELRKTVAVVTRYFGGVKLGVGGLARAYSGAVAAAIDKAVVAEFSEAEFYTFYLDYSQFKKLPSVLGNAAVINQEFGDKVTVEIAVKCDSEKPAGSGLVQRVADVFGNNVAVISGGKGYYGF